MKNNDIFVIYGNTPKMMVKELLSQIRPELEIPKDSLIGIKPNLVTAKPSTSGATTTPEIVAGVIEYLHEKGLKKICILEGSGVGKSTSKAFKVCGYEDISKLYNVPLSDLQTDSSKEYDILGTRISVCDKVMNIDYLINIPVLKGHCQTGMTCALKNMKGCIPNSEKMRFHTMGLHKPIAYLNKLIKQDLIIIDGLMGDLNYEEGGNPVEMNRIIAAKDPVLADSYVASLMGFEIEEVPYIKISETIGVGSTNLSNAVINEINSDRNTSQMQLVRKHQGYSGYVEENQACSACYGSLVHALERMRKHGTLSRIGSKLYIGQYYKQKSMEGIGIGSCTACFKRYVKGCPPKAADILRYLENR